MIAAALDHSSPQRQKLPAMLWQVFIPVCGLLAGSLLLNHLGVDMAFQRAVYSPGEGWAAGDRFPWNVLYHLGTLPAMLAVLVALVGLILKLGRRLPQERNFATVYLALVLAVGPGLFANLILKEHWGRPRPREVVEFGGRHSYEPPLWRDAASTGKSFPCGHATMGFFFFGHFFIHRRRHPRLAWVAFASALALGWLIGFARAMQGGHFISDIWWAMGLMWLTCGALWQGTHWMEQKKWCAAFFNWLQRRPRTGAALVGVIILLATVGALLATPYQREQDVAAGPLPAERRLKLSGIFQEGDIEIHEAADARLKVSANGHGMVWSKVLSGVRQREEDDLFETRFVQTREGWFTELNQDMILHFPVHRAEEILMTLRSTELAFNLEAAAAAQTWKFMGEGEVIVGIARDAAVTLQAGPEVSVKGLAELGFVRGDRGRWLKAGKGSSVKLQLALSKGTLTLVPGRVTNGK